MDDAFAFDDSRHPIVIVEFRRRATDAELEAYLLRLEELARAEPRLILIVDVRPGSSPTRQQQQRHGEWAKVNRKLLRRGATVFVMPHPAMRLVLSMIMLVSGGIANAYAVVATLEQALSWARGRLAAEGLHEPAAAGGPSAPAQ